MPQLLSPGVSVIVIDESFYAQAGPGTIPLIFIATREDKTAIPDPQRLDTTTVFLAEGTTKENAGRLWLITSQRELIQTFGEPTFVVEQGTPSHGNELNEWGLHAAFSYLGIANRAFVIRGDLDLGQMAPTPFEPDGDPINGTYWFSIFETEYGVFRSNGANSAPGATSFLDFNVGNVELVDFSIEAETRVIGTVRVDGPSSDLITGPGSLWINGVAIPFSGTTSMADVISAINGASISGISASGWWTSKGVALKIFADNAGFIDFTGTTGSVDSDIGLPLDSSGIDASPGVAKFDTGDFAIVTLDNMNRIYEKMIPVDADGTALTAVAEWFHIGTDSWREPRPTLVLGDTNTPTFSGADTLDFTLTLNGGVTVTSTVTGGSWSSVADVIADVLGDGTLGPFFSSGQIFAEVDGGSGAFRFENRDGGAVTIAGVAIAVELGIDTPVKARVIHFADILNIPDNTREGTIWIKTDENNDGADWKIKIYNDEIRQFVELNAPLYSNDTVANAPENYGDDAGAGVLYVQYDPSVSEVAEFLIKRWNGVTWEELTYVASVGAPDTPPDEGQLWFNVQFEVDIMVGDGQRWLGLNNHPWYGNAEIILNGSKPTQKNVGSPFGTDLVENDLWIDTTELEEYPKIYRFREATKRWELINNTDQTTPFGIVFADARWTDGAGNQDNQSFADSNFVDPDAPNPLTYPNGMLLWNTRWSTLNVKEWKGDHLRLFTEPELLANEVFPAQYEVGLGVFDPIEEDDAGRWVTASGNQVNGAPWMFRLAQRQMTVRALAAEIIGNQDIRAEFLFYNLIASPGYVELLDEMVTLNTDKKLWAFIVGDTPARLKPDGTSIQNWATNFNNAPSNSDLGLTTGNTYVGLYYPWALGTNLDGFEIMIPPSTVALRTIAFNDNVAYPWFAPAGFNRGIVTNAASAGFLTSEREYQPIILNPGQRDTLYVNKINPIAFMPGRGLVIWGQKTLHPIASALDRVNVVRLINYLRFQFDIIAKPFLFEPNDKITRDAVQITFERFLADLITLRALFDFAVIVDESNNTPLRIDRNELWIDVAIKPIKVIEFIYIPIRILTTGAELPTSANATSTLRP